MNFLPFSQASFTSGIIPSALRTFFNISCIIGLLVINSFRFYMSVKVFVLSLFLIRFKKSSRSTMFCVLINILQSFYGTVKLQESS